MHKITYQYRMSSGPIGRVPANDVELDDLLETSPRARMSSTSTTVCTVSFKCPGANVAVEVSEILQEIAVNLGELVMLEVVLDETF